jgi:superfamily II DNA or RNA helicase
MLRDEQIEVRRRRAAAEPLQIQNLGRNRVFSDYQVTNPTTGGQYHVSIRGFDVGDNACDCPDFKTNTLGTCKHIEAVIASLGPDAPAQVRRRKAVVTIPQLYLDYRGEALRLGLHLPPRCSDTLRALAEAFFDLRGLWKGGERYEALLRGLDQTPERVVVNADAHDFIEREIERAELAERERELLEQLERSETEQAELPSALRELLGVPLYPYQLRGALFLACRGRAILGDDMGLGKTVQTMAAVELLARERGLERVLVVAPASVKYQWETEIRKFSGRDVQVIEGTAAARRTQYARPTFYRLINYEVVVRDLNDLNSWQPDLIVLDEAQRIKNWETKTSRAVKRMRSRYAFVLTGTPLENKLEELFSIVSFVDDRRLGPAFQFLHDHRLLDDEGKLLGYRNLDRIREKLAPILLRRTRAEVLNQLPARTDNTVFVEMAEPQRRLYAVEQQNLMRLIGKKYLNDAERKQVLCCLANLRMVCDSTFLLDKQTNVSPKLDELDELLKDLLSSGSHKVVLFSQWEMMVQRAADVVRGLGFRFAMLHGSVPGLERRGLLERFRDDPDCRVFLSTDAGGTGLNLQAADTVINLESPWNPAVLEQRIARVHRLGQHRPVQVFHLVTRDSIEERVLQTLERKRELFEGVFAGGDDEVLFSNLGRTAFLETVRELVEAPQPPPAATIPRAEEEALTLAGVQWLEALAEGAALLTMDARTGQPVLQIPLPTPEALHRAAAALQAIARRLQTISSPPPAGDNAEPSPPPPAPPATGSPTPP